MPGMSNPYLGDQAAAITRRVTNNLNRNILPGVNQNAIAAGGMGGSRQGIAQGLAVGETNQGLSDSLSTLYGNAYEVDQNRDVQRYGIDTTAGTARYGMDRDYDLGLGRLGLDTTREGNNFYLGNRGYDLDALRLGNSIYQDGSDTSAGAGPAVQDGGAAVDQNLADWLKTFGGTVDRFTGTNNTRTDQTPGTSAAGSGFGGAITGAQLYKLIFGGP